MRVFLLVTFYEINLTENKHNLKWNCSRFEFLRFIALERHLGTEMTTIYVERQISFRGELIYSDFENNKLFFNKD